MFGTQRRMKICCSRGNATVIFKVNPHAAGAAQLSMKMLPVAGYWLLVGGYLNRRFAQINMAQSAGTLRHS